MGVTIKTSYQRDEPLAENFAPDLAWINDHRLELYEQYGDCVILVYHEEVIGSGVSVQEAVAEAEKYLSDREGIVTPLITTLSNPYHVGLFHLRKPLNKFNDCQNHSGTISC